MPGLEIPCCEQNCRGRHVGLRCGACIAVFAVQFGLQARGANSLRLVAPQTWKNL
jgi:hypothetical protein